MVSHNPENDACIYYQEKNLNLAFANDEEDGPLRSGPTFVQENYGEILLDKLTNTLTVNLKDNQGKIIQSLSL